VNGSERADSEPVGSYPCERLRIELAAARTHGASFEEAWEQALPLALREARWASEWMEALTATRPAWEIAYGGRGSTKLIEAMRTHDVAEVMGDGQRPGGAQLVA
jgi:hypothetical protein